MLRFPRLIEIKTKNRTQQSTYRLAGEQRQPLPQPHPEIDEDTRRATSHQAS
jgi:hypothetical protein